MPGMRRGPSTALRFARYDDRSLSLLLPARQRAVLRRIDAPGIVGEGLVLGSLVRAAKAVPVRHTGLARIELRDHEHVPAQQPVERLRAGDQAVAIGCGDDQRDQMVDRGILDADRIAPALDVRRARAPVVALLV